MTTSDRVFSDAQRAWEEPSEDGPDFLADKPKGACPWCDSELEFDDDGDCLYCPTIDCHGFDSMLSEESNRARYAKEAERAAEVEARNYRLVFREGEF